MPVLSPLDDLNAALDKYASPVDDAAKDAVPDSRLSQAQRDAGNYRLGHVRLGGLNISIENRKGTYRIGQSKDGTIWKRYMRAHYGYVRGTLGNDDDHCDVYIGPHAQSELVFVVDQVKKDGTFDETKSVLGCLNKEQAKQLYLSHYPDNWTGFSAITPMTWPQFRHWLREGDMSQPAADQAPEMKKAAAAEDAVLAPLRAAQKASDLKQYAKKVAILRQLMQAHPDDWHIDTPRGKHFGVTHKTGFKFHMDRTAIPPSIKQSADFSSLVQPTLAAGGITPDGPARPETVRPAVNLGQRFSDGLRQLWQSPQPEPSGLPWYNSAVYNALQPGPGKKSPATMTARQFGIANTLRAPAAAAMGRRNFVYETPGGKPIVPMTDVPSLLAGQRSPSSVGMPSPSAATVAK